jgi:steroid Delta-isomerase
LVETITDTTTQFKGDLPMDLTARDPLRRDFLADCERIHREWDSHAKSLDTDSLISLYAQDAILETPLVPAIFAGRSGILRGHREIRPFFEEGARRRPNELVRWYRTDNWFTDGKRILVWEYPRQAPDGDQIELMEVMEIEHGLIQHHRIYWGWFGVNQLIQSATAKATRTA